MPRPPVPYLDSDGRRFIVLDTPNNEDIYGPHAHVLSSDVHLLLTVQPRVPDLVPTLFNNLIYRTLGHLGEDSETLWVARRGSLLVTCWRLKNNNVVTVVHQISEPPKRPR